MGLGILKGVSKRIGIYIIIAAVMISLLPCKDVMAADKPVLVLTKAEEYTVLSGDSLWTIAEEYLGDGICYRELADANQDIITNPDLIYPGMNINIEKNNYIERIGKQNGGLQMGEYSLDIPYGWTVGLEQMGEAFSNFSLHGSEEGSVSCLILDRTDEISADVFNWQECTKKISDYADKNYHEHVSDLHFEHYVMKDQQDISGELYLYSYTWHIYPIGNAMDSITNHVCVGIKLTEHIQAEFIGYSMYDNYDIQNCVRSIAASFAEHYNANKGQNFTVNDSGMCLLPESEWSLKGMYNSFAYIDEMHIYINKRLDTLEEEIRDRKKSRYRSFS